MTNSPLFDRLRARRQLPEPAERKRIRVSAGASLRDLAAEMNVSTTSIVRWESGASPGARTRRYLEVLDELERIAA